VGNPAWGGCEDRVGVLGYLRVRRWLGWTGRRVVGLGCGGYRFGSLVCWIVFVCCRMTGRGDLIYLSCEGRVDVLRTCEELGTVI
jgi:hypothetical protein